MHVDRKSMLVAGFLVICLKEANLNKLVMSRMVQVTTEVLHLSTRCISRHFLFLVLHEGFQQFKTIYFCVFHAGLDLVLACSEISIESSSLIELVDDWLCTGEICPTGVGNGFPFPVMKDNLALE
jgi:hypothetical protein